MCSRDGQQSRSVPASSRRPCPAETTVACCGFSFAVSGTMMPAMRCSGSSRRLTRSRSRSGRTFMKYLLVGKIVVTRRTLPTRQNQGVAVVIHDDHALRGLFEELVRRQFYRADLYDSDIVAYVGGVLASFTHTDRLYQIRNAQGRRLEDVAEMLIESNPLLEATSFHREREVRKHIGDFTLFFAGFYPEAIASLPRVHPLSVDTFV